MYVDLFVRKKEGCFVNLLENCHSIIDVADDVSWC